MAAPDRNKWGAAALLVGGAITLVLGIFEIVLKPDALADYGPTWLDVVLAPIGILLLLGIAAIRTQHARIPRARRGLLVAMLGLGFVAVAGSSNILPITGVLSGVGFLVLMIGILMAVLANRTEFPAPLGPLMLAVALWPIAIFATGGFAQSLSALTGSGFGWRSVMQVLLHALTPGFGILWMMVAIAFRRMGRERTNTVATV